MTIQRIALVDLPVIWATLRKSGSLPTTNWGKHKWVAMGEEYKLDGVKPPKEETMERVKALFLKSTVIRSCSNFP